ncbi:hypothetical protein Micbo1qcDRAFT_222001, partial [Microdochium bolleyi]
MRSFNIFSGLVASAGLAQAYTLTHVAQFMDKNIDPIVFPGSYKDSHLHTFFGSDAVTANTTTSPELQGGCATADNPNDFSTYWIPTLLYNDGKDWKPAGIFRFSAYYVVIEAAEVPIPQNFRAVAGKATAKSKADIEPLSGLQIFCEGETVAVDDSMFPVSTCATHLQTLLLFHDCVDEATLQSAYSGTHNWSGTFRPANRCPQGMKRIPQLRFSIRFDLRKNLPAGWKGAAPLKFASGAGYTLHGDFINGWLQIP